MLSIRPHANFQNVRWSKLTQKLVVKIGTNLHAQESLTSYPLQKWFLSNLGWISRFDRNITRWVGN